MFLPFEDRVFEGESGNLDDKVLVCDVMDVEDLIYFHEVSATGPEREIVPRIRPTRASCESVPRRYSAKFVHEYVP